MMFRVKKYGYTYTVYAVDNRGGKAYFLLYLGKLWEWVEADNGFEPA